MKTISQLLIGTVLVTSHVPGWCADQATSSTSIDFAREILLILSNKCFVCHGPSAEDSDQLRLDTEQAATANRGVDPDNPSKSELLRRIHSQTEPMPPPEAKRQLTAGERELLTQWIREGGKYTKHWSFVPPTTSHIAELASYLFRGVISSFEDPLSSLKFTSFYSNFHSGYGYC